MPAHITETLYNSTGTELYNGPIRFSRCGQVAVVNSDVITGEPIDLVIVGGALDVTLTEGTYLVRMRGTNDFYIEVPAGDDDYQLYELIMSTGSAPPIGGGIITTSPQDIPPDEATIARLNIGAAGLADTTGTPNIPTISVARELTAEEVGTGTPVAYTGAGGDIVTYLNLGNRYRALNGEKAAVVQVWLASTTPADCKLMVEAWRRSLEGRWRRVWQSPDLRGTVTPANAVASLGLSAVFSSVQGGDYFAIRIEYAPGSYAPVLGDKATPADPLYNDDAMSYARLQGDASNGADWDGATKVTARSICLQARGERCPAVAVLGFDQFLAWPRSDSIYYPTMVFDRRSDLGPELETFVGVTTRNASRRGLRMADQVVIWTTDLGLVFPRVVVIHASARADIQAGTTQAAWLASLQAIIDSVTGDTGNAGLAVVVAELPFTDDAVADADELNRMADEWMDAAQQAVTAVGGAKAAWLDLREAFGTLRAGGDAGNIWALRPEYDSGDGLTLTRHGITRLAIGIGNSIRAFMRRLQSNTPQQFAVRSTVGGNIGDQDRTLAYSGYPATYYPATTPLTANRVVTLPTVGIPHGTEIGIHRTAGGAFTYDVGGLTTLAQNQWCRLQFQFSLWALVARGSLT